MVAHHTPQERKKEGKKSPSIGAPFPIKRNKPPENRYESILGRSIAGEGEEAEAEAEALLQVDAEGRPFTANPEDLFQVT